MQYLNDLFKEADVESGESEFDIAEMAIAILQRPLAGLTHKRGVGSAHALVQGTMLGDRPVRSIAAMEVVQSSVGYFDHALFYSVLRRAAEQQLVTASYNAALYCSIYSIPNERALMRFGGASLICLLVLAAFSVVSILPQLVQSLPVGIVASGETD